MFCLVGLVGLETIGLSILFVLFVVATFVVLLVFCLVVGVEVAFRSVIF